MIFAVDTVNGNIYRYNKREMNKIANMYWYADNPELIDSKTLGSILCVKIEWEGLVFFETSSQAKKFAASIIVE